MTNAIATRDLDSSLPELGKLLTERLVIVGSLAESLEASHLDFRRRDAEAIARGAAHQAELCRHWSRLEEALRSRASRRQPLGSSAAAVSPATERSAQLDAEWAALSERIRYLTRIHCSLLRHMQRCLAIWSQIIASRAPTYTPVRQPVFAPAGPARGD